MTENQRREIGALSILTTVITGKKQEGKDKTSKLETEGKLEKDTKMTEDTKKSDDKNKVVDKRSRSNGDDDDAGRGRKLKRETIGKKQALFRETPT